MIGEEFVFFSVLYVKLFELGCRSRFQQPIQLSPLTREDSFYSGGSAQTQWERPKSAGAPKLEPIEWIS